MKRKLKILFILVMINGRSAFAQMLTPFVISSSGDFNSNGTAMLSSTIGEMTLTETFSGGSNILTQGFQQPSDFGVSITSLSDIDMEIELFPNPATDHLNISIRSDKDMKYILTMFDILGQKISAGIYTPSLIGSVCNMDISSLATGIYTLNVETATHSFSRTIRFNKM